MRFKLVYGDDSNITHDLESDNIGDAYGEALSILNHFIVEVEECPECGSEDVRDVMVPDGSILLERKECNDCGEEF